MYKKEHYQIICVSVFVSHASSCEVKSGSETAHAGLAAFRKKYTPYASIIVGQGGINADKFLSINPAKLFD